MRGGPDDLVKLVDEVGLACLDVLVAFPALRFAFRVRAFSRVYKPGLLRVGAVYGFRIDVYLDCFSSYRWREPAFSCI